MKTQPEFFRWWRCKSWTLRSGGQSSQIDLLIQSTSVMLKVQKCSSWHLTGSLDSLPNFLSPPPQKAAAELWLDGSSSQVQHLNQTIINSLRLKEIGPHWRSSYFQERQLIRRLQKLLITTGPRSASGFHPCWESRRSPIGRFCCRLMKTPEKKKKIWSFFNVRFHKHQTKT